MQSPGKRIAFLSIAVALGLILSYVEALIPIFAGVPGMKCGLSNILVVYLLYAFGPVEAATVNALRILLVSFLFTNPFSLAYSLAGAIFSLLGMLLLKKTGIFSIYGVSMAGGMLHNLGQIMVAAFLVENYHVYYYLPVLLVSGCITGWVVGLLAGRVLKTIRWEDSSLRSE